MDSNAFQDIPAIKTSSQIDGCRRRPRRFVATVFLGIVAVGTFFGWRTYELITLDDRVRAAGGHYDGWSTWTRVLKYAHRFDGTFRDRQGAFANRYTGILFFESSVDDRWIARHAYALSRQPDLLLTLRRSPITDLSLQTISRFDNLQGLWLVETAVSDQGLRQLIGLSGLQFLDVAHTNVTDQGLAILQQFPKLTLIGVDRSQATPAGLEMIATCDRLNQLEIYDANDELVTHLGQLPAITDLTLHGAGVTDASIQSLLDLPNLKDLRLVGCSISEEGIYRLTMGLNEWITVTSKEKEEQDFRDLMKSR